jgi:hypothetical protein
MAQTGGDFEIDRATTTPPAGFTASRTRALPTPSPFSRLETSRIHFANGDGRGTAQRLSGEEAASGSIRAPASFFWPWF